LEKSISFETITCRLAGLADRRRDELIRKGLGYPNLAKCRLDGRGIRE
jgi:hypothetical protein